MLQIHRVSSHLLQVLLKEQEAHHVHLLVKPLHMMVKCCITGKVKDSRRHSGLFSLKKILMATVIHLLLLALTSTDVLHPMMLERHVLK